MEHGERNYQFLCEYQHSVFRISPVQTLSNFNTCKH
jgi:hypothetical protein